MTGYDLTSEDPCMAYMLKWEYMKEPYFPVVYLLFKAKIKCNYSGTQPHILIEVAAEAWFRRRFKNHRLLTRVVCSHFNQDVNI